MSGPTQADMDALVQQLADLQARLDKQEKDKDVGGAPRLVYTQRKIQKFEGDLSKYEGWKMEVKAALRNLGKGTGVRDFFLSHLEGAARREIYYSREADTDTEEKCFKILDEIYGETRLADDLEDAFHSREQREGESLMAFSHALQSLVQRVRTKDPTKFPDKEKVLVDRFSRKVSHKGLRRELNDQVKRNPNITLRELRSAAVTWMKEEDPEYDILEDCEVDTKKKKVKVEDRKPKKMVDIYETEVKPDERYKELVEIQRRQQEQIEQQNKLILSLMNEKRQQNKKSEIKCFHCGKLGHIRKDCFRWKAKQAAATDSTVKQTVTPSAGIQAHQHIATYPPYYYPVPTHWAHGSTGYEVPPHQPCVAPMQGTVPAQEMGTPPQSSQQLNFQPPLQGAE